MSYELREKCSYADQYQAIRQPVCHCKACWRKWYLKHGKPYKNTVNLQEIVADGWSRNFDPRQTIREAWIMGYDLSPKFLMAAWKDLDKRFKAFNESSKRNKYQPPRIELEPEEEWNPEPSPASMGLSKDFDKK